MFLEHTFAALLSCEFTDRAFVVSSEHAKLANHLKHYAH